MISCSDYLLEINPKHIDQESPDQGMKNEKVQTIPKQKIIKRNIEGILIK